MDNQSSAERAYNVGVRHLGQCDYSGACRLFLQAIERNEDVADAYNGLGVAWQALNDGDKAASYFNLAIHHSPDNGKAQFNLGLLRKAEGKLDEALKSLKRACDLAPSEPNFALKYAEICRFSGRPDEAAKVLEAYVATNPDDFPVWSALAESYLVGKNFSDAVRGYRMAYKINPQDAVTTNNLGWALQKLGNYEGASEVLENGVEIHPDDCTLWRNLASVYEHRGHKVLAQLCYRHTLEINPHSSKNHYQFGYFLYYQGNLELAEHHFAQASVMGKKMADAHNMLANTFVLQGRLADARESFARAIEINPRDPGYWVNSAVAHRQLGDYEQALECFESAEEVDPLYPDARFGKGMLLLLQGEFQRGWVEYEWRIKQQGFAGIVDLALPRWGGESLAGKRLFVHAEQGLGDTIQFVRYLETVRLNYKPAEIVFCCDPVLVTLLAGVCGADRLVCAKAPPPDMDYHIHLLSIPRVVATTLQTVPSTVPYLNIEIGHVARWANFVPASNRLRIGFVWRGRPTHANDRTRSMTVDHFASIMERAAEAEFFSLQYGDAGLELPRTSTGARVTDLGGQLRDFVDTAAAILNLDLVITVDTSVAHLAGALAKPVWTLLPFDPDWRWLLELDTTPWYPTMRLFRQPAPGDWGAVVSAVGTALQSWR